MTKAIIGVLSVYPDITYACKSTGSPDKIKMIVRNNGIVSDVELYTAGMTEEIIEETFFKLLSKTE
jgi:hypothetical protein